MPPVLTGFEVLDSTSTGHTGDLVANQSYTLTWSLEGYHSDYTSNLVLFDCTGINDGTCGDSYGDATRFAESGNQEPASVAAGSWQFGGVVTQRFTYTWSFTVPLKRENGSDWPTGGTDIVVRFYNKSEVDQERNKGSVSLLVPGNLASEYYDTTGRRIVKRITP
jgi:hypothetical protein